MPKLIESSNLDDISYQLWYFAKQVVFPRYFYDINHFFNSVGDISSIFRGAKGRLNINSAPPSWLFLAVIVPPCASMILLEINRPSPVPVADFVANLLNSLGIISASIPEPVSVTLTITWLFSIDAFTDTLPFTVKYVLW